MKRSAPHGTHFDFLILITLVGDALTIFLGLTAAFWVRFRSGLIPFFGMDDPHLTFNDYFRLFVIGTGSLILAFGYLQLYDIRRSLRYRRVGDIIIKGTILWLFLYLGISLALKFEPPISRIYAIASALLCMLGMLLWRRFLHALIHREYFIRNLRQRIAFVGWNSQAEGMFAAIKHDPSNPYEVVSCVSMRLSGRDLQLPSGLPVVEGSEALAEMITSRDVDLVILADPEMHIDEVTRLSNLCEAAFVQFKIIPSYAQIMATGLQVESISGVPVVGLAELPLDRTLNRALKRCVDVLGSLVGIFLATPILLICAAAIYLESPGSIFFMQERVGRRGQRFQMIKLRSMKLGAERSDHLNQSTLRKDPRLLRWGALIRKWNLDETPQFWNVFKGEMSLVGPRPERSFHSEKLSREIPHYNARYSSKPGMTGWAQIHGLRGDTSLEERVRYDLFYLEKWSLLLDIQIMCVTLFRRHNAY